MITGTYVVSGLLLLVTAWLFGAGVLSATTMTVCWLVVLFFASAGASSAYLTVSEIFPMETRALAIAFFYAVGTAAGGITGPLLFAHLVGSGKVGDTVVAFVIGAILMIRPAWSRPSWGSRPKEWAWRAWPPRCPRPRRSRPPPDGSSSHHDWPGPLVGSWPA